MNAIKSNSYNDSFSLFMLISLAVHIVVIGAFTVKTLLFPSTDIIISQAIKVDMVALPEKKAPSPKAAPATKPRPKPVPKKNVKKPVQKVNLKDAKKRQNNAFERLNALNAIDKIKQEVNQQKKSPPKKQPKAVKGNAINKGNSLSGLDKLEFDVYFDKLQKHVKENWDLPQWLANADHKAEAWVTIDERGYITNKEIVLPSGNQVFDDRVLDTLSKSSPCPIPPARIADVLATMGVNFSFP